MFSFFLRWFDLRYLILLLPYSAPRSTTSIYELSRCGRDLGIWEMIQPRRMDGPNHSMQRLSSHTTAIVPLFRAVPLKPTSSTHQVFTSDSNTRHSLCIHHVVPLSACDGFAGLFPSPFVRDLLLGEGLDLIEFVEQEGLMLFLQDHIVDKKLPLLISPFPSISIPSVLIPPMPLLGHHGICVSWNKRTSSQLVSGISKLDITDVLSKYT